MEDCIFCKIVNKEIPAVIEYDNEHAIVFKDLEPLAPEHYLIVPKKHIPSFLDFGKGDEEIITGMVGLAQVIIKDKKLENEYRLRFNGGKAQHVPHVHWHLLGKKPYLIV